MTATTRKAALALVDMIVSPLGRCPGLDIANEKLGAIASAECELAYMAHRSG
jgi:hypothetical protein